MGTLCKLQTTSQSQSNFNTHKILHKANQNATSVQRPLPKKHTAKAQIHQDAQQCFHCLQRPGVLSWFCVSYWFTAGHGSQQESVFSHVDLGEGSLKASLQNLLSHQAAPSAKVTRGRSSTTRSSHFLQIIIFFSLFPSSLRIFMVPEGTEALFNEVFTQDRIN